MPRLRLRWQEKGKHLAIIGIIAAVVLGIGLVVVISLGYWFNWDWTGLNGGYSTITITRTPNGTITVKELLLAKTLWDWMQLLIIPIALGIGGFWLNKVQKDREQRTTDQQAALERELTRDNQREAALQSYVDKMSELLLHGQLRGSMPDGEVRKIARVRTLTVLPRLDPLRKRSVLQFLQESSLIDKGKRIVDLGGAFLNGADLFEIDLSSADLSRADLSRADLRGGNLREADLTEAVLTEALLTGAILTQATLTEAQLMAAALQGADLTEATLARTYLIAATLQGAILTKATLTKAYLRGANLMEADLTDADLTDADLTGATITREQWEKAKLLQGATLPDGSIHP